MTSTDRFIRQHHVAISGKRFKFDGAVPLTSSNSHDVFHTLDKSRRNKHSLSTAEFAAGAKADADAKSVAKRAQVVFMVIVGCFKARDAEVIMRALSFVKRKKLVFYRSGLLIFGRLLCARGGWRGWHIPT